MARPRKIENTFDNRTTTTFSNPPGQSKGILADDVTRTVVRSKEGTIEHIPTLDNHILNKKYVHDGNILLDEVGDPSANHTFTMANKQLKFRYTAPAVSDGGFEIEAVGGFSGDLVHIHQHTGNPGTTDLLHLESVDADVTPLRVVGHASSQIEFETELSMNLEQIKDLADPTLSQDAATMKYVDDEVLPKIEWSDVPIAITFIIDGGGEDITTGRKGFISVPFECTINSVTMLGDNAGSMVCDIWIDSYANHPPTDADSITAAAVPELDGADRSTDSTLTGWSKVISAGDVIAYNVDSVADLQYVTITLKATRSD